MHVASLFCWTHKCVVESFLAEFGCCHYQLTPSTPTPSVPGAIFMHNTSIICSLVGGKSSLQVTCLNSSHIRAVSFSESHIYSLIYGGRKTNQKTSDSSHLQAFQSKYFLHLWVFEGLMGHSQSWWKLTQVWCTFAAMPVHTRQRTTAMGLCKSRLSAMRRIRLSSFAGCLQPHECLLVFKHATLDLHQHSWEEHRCVILEDRSSKSNVHLTNLILKSLRKALKTKAQIPE